MRAVNLLPRELERERSSLPAPLLVGCAAALLALAALAAGYLAASSHIDARRERVDALESRLVALPRPAASSPASDLAAQQRSRVSALGSALSTRVDWDRLLGDVSLVLPQDVWLSSLHAQEPSLAPATSSGTAPTGFTLSGYTYTQADVARLLSRLGAVADLQGIALQSSTRVKIGKRPAYSFSIGGDVRPPGAAS